MASSIVHIVLNHYEPEESAAAGCPMFSDTSGSGHQFAVMSLEEFAQHRGFDVAEVRRIIRDRPLTAPRPLVWEPRRPRYLASFRAAILRLSHRVRGLVIPVRQ
jgi:hypothetical protein